ncbi:hypothetical protein [Gluconobacter kondonii]|uniref:hypothetical protein n=1 Tax=Gluconobacter kondonii TaxID=941463 RepID=UPI001981605E|nr:hypothetical protein [Gluconobacter kondonii]MBN3868520.1 hypothetical protein [Gluconobacter kondonii]
MIRNNIKDILYETKWHENISKAMEHGACTKIDDLCKKIAIISKQIEFVDKENPSICFIREMQFSLHQAAALIGISLYKASVASLRTFVESFLYYSYFRNHNEELKTLLRVDDYYVSKSSIIEYHNFHTFKFKERSKIFSFESLLNEWYSKSSAIIHGQIPGDWNTHFSLLQINHSDTLLNSSIDNMEKSVSLVIKAILSTMSDENWFSITFESKREITKGIDKRKLLSAERVII